MGPLFRLSLRQLTGRWRLLIILLLAAFPVAIAAFIARIAENSEGSHGEMLDGMVVAAGPLGSDPA